MQGVEIDYVKWIVCYRKLGYLTSGLIFGLFIAKGVIKVLHHQTQNGDNYSEDEET